MILKNGCDLVHIPRFEKILQKEHAAHFLARVFTVEERAAFVGRNPEGRAAYWAKRYAAKEATAKALGTGIWQGDVTFHDIEVFCDELGAPHLELSGAAAARFDTLGLTAHAVSLSSDGQYAMAQVTLLGPE